MTRKKIAGKNRRDLTPEIMKALLHPCLTGDDIANNSHLQGNEFIFESDAARRKAWFEHRSAIMAMTMQPGFRPDAWWRYEAPDQRWFGESQLQALDRLNLLREDEIEYFKMLNRWPVVPVSGPDYDPRVVLHDGAGG